MWAWARECYAWLFSSYSLVASDMWVLMAAVASMWLRRLRQTWLFLAVTTTGRVMCMFIAIEDIKAALPPIIGVKTTGMSHETLRFF